MGFGKRITGRRKGSGAVYCRVTPPNSTLSAPLRLTKTGRGHSPTGFEWGYNGSGPAALAHSILAEVLGESEADALYMRFKRDVIAHLPREQFELTGDDVRAWALAHPEGDAACRTGRTSCREPNLAAGPSWMERATKMAGHLQAAIGEHIMLMDEAINQGLEEDERRMSSVERVTDRTLRVVGADGVRFIVTVVEEDA